MKKIPTLALCALAFAVHAQSSHYVNPYVNKNGTYVEGHHQTNPDGNRLNNWSTQGNVNPYTGEAGRVNPYQQTQPTSPYQQQGTSNSYSQQCGYTSAGRYVCR